MLVKEDLRSRLARIDGRGYKAYKSIEGAYKIKDYVLYIDHAQSDPFAPPSRVRVRVNQDAARFPQELFKTPGRKTALEDFLTRAFAEAIEQVASGRRGTGKSGLISIVKCGQEILPRTSMVVNRDFVEARFSVGLPAAGRRVLARQAMEIFFEEVDKIARRSLFYGSLDSRKVEEHVLLAEDQEFLRARLAENKLVAFVANGSILPRESGVSDRPLREGKVIPFQSPGELEVSFDLPNRGKITGMGILEGVTLIVGGGYHGKSTLLRAIERGVYNHIPGDGREFVLTVEDAVKIRAEDGRSIEKCDISGFINNLPYGQETVDFTTENASGSTSQAANIVEALEIGTHLLLLDEDTSATNFMIRDGRMQQLVVKESEPITPFIDRVRQLYENFNVSTILVVGGSGDYFDVADRVIMMENYIPKDVTSRAKKIAQEHKDDRKVELMDDFTKITQRIPLAASFQLGPRGKVKSKGLGNILYGRSSIDLHNVEQLVDPGQTVAIAEIIRYAAQKYVDGKRTLREVVEAVLGEISRQGMDVVSPFKGQHPGDYALPRKYEIAAAINRLRKLKVRQKV